MPLRETLPLPLLNFETTSQCCGVTTTPPATFSVYAVQGVTEAIKMLRHPVEGQLIQVKTMQ